MFLSGDGIPIPSDGISIPSVTLLNRCLNGGCKRVYGHSMILFKNSCFECRKSCFLIQIQINTNTNLVYSYE